MTHVDALRTVTSNGTTWKVYSILGIGMLAAAISPVVIRLAQLEGIPSPIIAAGRLTLASLILSPIVWRYYAAEISQLRRADFLLAIAGGICLTASFNAFFGSLEHTSVLISNVLDGTSPLWVAILELIFLKSRPRKLTWIGLLLALVGGFVIAIAGGSGILLGDNPVLGGLLALSASMSYAAYTIIGRKGRQRLPLVPYIWLVFCCAAVASLLFVLLVGLPVGGYSSKGYFWVLVTTVVSQMVYHPAYNYALRYLSPTYLSILGQLGLIMAVMFAVMFFHEVPGWPQVIGGAAIVVGVTLATLSRGRARPVHGTKVK